MDKDGRAVQEIRALNLSSLATIPSKQATLKISSSSHRNLRVYVSGQTHYALPVFCVEEEVILKSMFYLWILHVCYSIINNVRIQIHAQIHQSFDGNLTFSALAQSAKKTYNKTGADATRYGGVNNLQSVTATQICFSMYYCW